MSKYKYIKKINGDYTKMEYWIIKYCDNNQYCFGYKIENEIIFSPREHDDISEVIKDINDRELYISNGDTVLF